MSALPNKYVPIPYSILGVASFLAASITLNDTVSTLWDRVREDDRVRTFDRFAEGLTLLHAGGILQLENGILHLRPKPSAMP